jgi:hypothetical protein
MYIRQQDAMENTIMPALMITTLAHYQKDDIEGFKRMSNILMQDIDKVLKKNVKLYKALNSLTHRMFKYFIENKFCTRKCFITIKEAAEALEHNEVIYLYEGTKNTFNEIEGLLDNKEALKKHGLSLEDVENIRKSCVKHATKLIKKLQKDGYY